MSFFRWAMRYGAAILFVIALLQLVVSIVVILQAYSAAGGGGATYELNSVPERPGQIWVLLQGLIAALTTPTLTFFGALVVNRLDRRVLAVKEAEPFE